MIVIQPPDAVTPGRFKLVHVLDAPYHLKVSKEHAQHEIALLSRSCRIEESKKSEAEEQDRKA